MRNLSSVSEDPLISSSIMKLSGITKRFGKFAALNNLNFEIKRGEIFGIAGPNGAGKSTLLNICTGLLRATEGSLLFDGHRMEKLRPHRFCQHGIGRTFQIPTILSSLTVEENVRTGAMFGSAARHTVAEIQERTEATLEMANLKDNRHQPASTADLLTRKMIMLATALATDPKIMFMDEPFGGLNTREIEEFSDIVSHLHQEVKLSFVIVEHKIKALTKLSDRLLILNFGELLRVDTPDVILNDEEVIEIYLGASHHDQD